MIIAIDETNRIHGTAMCWQLEEIRIRKGKSKWVPYKYYATAEQALTAAAQRELRTDPAHTIAEAIEACNRVWQKYSRILDSEQRNDSVA